MDQWIVQLLLTIFPAAIVGGVVYLVLRQLLQRDQQREQFALRKDLRSTSLPLRLQAYERLSLLCERIQVNNLLLRAQPEGRNANQLRAELLLNIQQEYEHNITQQVYVSEKLWLIIQAARDDTAEMISLAADTGGSAQDMANRLMNMLLERGDNPLSTAQRAIRQEAGSLFG